MLGASFLGRRVASLAGLALALAGAGCTSNHLVPTGTSKDADQGQVACDPLAGPPIALGAVVGVGVDAAGTTYVDAANGVFVAVNGALVRQHVVGTGQIGANQFIFTFTAPGDDVSTARDLMVQTEGAGGVTMQLGPQGSGKTGSDAGVVELMVVAASTVAGMPVVNTPNVIQYVADAANGEVLVATRPLNDQSGPSDGGIYDGGLSIFYGAPPTMPQRPITAFSESLSGTGTVTFLVDGTPTTLAFGNVQAPDAGPFGTFTLLGLSTPGGASMAITLRSPTPTAPPANLTFICLP
jgi:hypothetical protein